GYAVTFINDNVVRSLENNVGTNGGLQQAVALTGVAGRLSSRQTVPTPVFQVPTTFADRYRLNRGSAFGLPDPNLATPYVQQWTAGIQREIAGNVIEIRYVGNKGTKLLRGIDFNQVDIQAHGFFQDFLRAYNNGNLARGATNVFNPAFNQQIPGSQPLPFFSQLPDGGTLNNAIYRGFIERGEPGAYASILQVDGRNGNFSFYRNPFALGTNMMTNYSNSSYHSLQVEVSRRMRAGLQLQGNYVYGKSLSDSGAESNEQFEALLDLNSPSIERARTTFDLTHQIKGNGLWQLPLGPGHKLHKPALRHLLGGWMVSGNMVWQSGAPFSVFSRRGTVNRDGRSNVNTANTNATKA
ncbi:MAG: hypothetical protein ACRD96_00985, partial [Bryobacteraceae bacterium]